MEKTINSLRDPTSTVLIELGVPVHRLGYKQLCVAIPLYAQNDMQSVTKELYPMVAKHFGCVDSRAIEHSIREAISDAWLNRDPAVWGKYFSACEKAPSNKQLIAVLAERIKQIYG